MWREFKSNKKKSVYTFISTAFLLLFSLIYFQKARIFIDPDFGWAIRMGDLILKGGIPRTDPFSYTMPSYPYVDYEWLTHIGTSLVYMRLGYSGLALIFTIIAVAGILICVSKSDRIFKPFQILLVSVVLFPFFGIRAQVISWFFLALLCRVVLNERVWNKYKYFIPTLFLIWSNLHGGFVIGLIILMFVYPSKQSFINLTVVTTSVLVTLVNPYGFSLWQEVWIALIDMPIRVYINEWRSLFFSTSLISFFSIAFFSAFIIYYLKKYNIFEILLFYLMLIAAFSSSRNLPLFIIYAVMLSERGINKFIADVNGNKSNRDRFHRLYIFIFLIVSILAFFEIKYNYPIAIGRTEALYYPQKAVEYLSRNLPTGQIYSSYSWGGYLDWKLPQKKVFIDGRMAGWRQNPTLSESEYIFDENNSLLLLKISLSKTFKKYNIDTVLLPSVWMSENPNNKLPDTAQKFVKELKKNKFREVYRDEVAIIYSKNLN